jgi:isoquinoline 1-oxidoreductase beta subunit
VPLTRRDVLVGGLTAAAGLAIGVSLPGWGKKLRAAWSGAAFSPSVWLEIAPDGQVTVTVAAAEMGQGVMTSLPMILADELDADWAKVAIRQAPVDEEVYGNPTTGGSDSVASSWDSLRRAGAAAREMLVAAAAARWGVLASACRTAEGAVLHPPSGRRAGYGELAREAAALPIPAAPRLKKPEERKIVGTRRARLDAPGKVDGTAVYGMDVEVPGMVYAALLRSPVFGGSLVNMEAREAWAVTGVRNVLAIRGAADPPARGAAAPELPHGPPPTAAAVVADSSWAAIEGCRRLRVTWDEGPNATLASDGIRRLFVERAATGGVTWRSDGDPARAAAAAAKRLEAVYEMPFLAHAPMEPGNTTARFANGRCELWSPTQAPDRVARDVAKELGIPRDAVTVHVTLLGGGFGRRLQTDYAVEAAILARALGQPVKVVWSREEDMGHDFYRPASYHRLAGALDAGGWPVAFEHLLAAPSLAARRDPTAARTGRDAVVENQAVFLYAVPCVKLSYAMANTAVPVGPLRSVYAAQAAFPTECFLDELAAAGGKDPLALRQRLLAADREIGGEDGRLSTARLRGVLELAAAKAGWGTPLPPGRFRGIACFPSFGTYVAEVAEVVLDPKATGGFRVERVVAAVDCGTVVNPDGLEAQVEGAVAYALSAARHSAITVQGGRVEQGNFDGFDVLRLPDMPRVEVHSVPGTGQPTGAGEPGMPPLAPAVANALFAATGRPLRTLPLRVA